MRLRFLLLFGAFAQLGCFLSYAPPLRGTHAGAPGHLGAGEAELAFATAGVGTDSAATPPLVFVPSIGASVSSHVALEAGANLSSEEEWTMFFVGPRFTFWPRPGTKHGIAVDLEFGGGLGRGGHQVCYDLVHHLPHGPCDGLAPADRDAFGGYAGAGVAWHYHLLSVYARARVEATSATHIATTFWPSVIAGVELDLWHHLQLGAAGGYVGVINGGQHADGWMYQFQLSVPFRLAANKP